MARMVMCGTPPEHCTGGKVPTNAFLRKANPTAHHSHTEAYRCFRRYLIKVLGYTDIGRREFLPPDDGPILFLTRKSKFGTSLRLGKMGERWMPRGRGRSGVVIKT